MPKRAPLEIAALLSDPLVSGGEPVARLNLKAAMARVRRQLQGIGRAARLRFVIANPEHLLNAVREFGPFDVLHFDGHGGKGELLLEDDIGEALPIDPGRLEAMFAPQGRPPAQVVFLSACHSASLARVFASLGVRHVVAIDSEAAVLDVAAQAFAAHFYPALCAGWTVRQAFEHGRAAVFNDPDVRTACAQLFPDTPDLHNLEEKSKFLLLPEPEGAQPDPHGVALFADGSPGELDVIETCPHWPETLPARPDSFVGRERELHEVLTRVREHPLTTITGIGGMGKSELCREAGRWFAARNRFPGGITLIRLGAVSQAEQARLALAAALGIDPRQAGTPEALARLLPADSLLLLDELDALVAEDHGATRALLEALVDHGPAKLLVSCRERTGASGEARYPLGQLAAPEARALFLDLAGRSGRTIRGSEAALQEVLGFLDGMPRAIELAAKQITSPELRWLAEDLRASQEKILHDPTIPEDERRDSHSVVITLDSSYTRLVARDPEAAELFLLLSLFPAGIGEEGLRAVFGTKARKMGTIWDLGLAEIAPPLDYYYLPAPLRSYASRRRTEDAMDRVAPAALAFFAALCDRYNELIVSGQDEAGVARFSAELPNLEAFLEWGYVRESGGGTSPARHSARIAATLGNYWTLPARRPLS